MVKTMQHHKSNCAVFYGTSAELIKLWPVIRALSSETETRLFTTNQQPIELRHLELQLGLTAVTHLRNEKKGNLVNRLQVVPWFFIALFTSVQTLRRFKRESREVNKKVLVIIHGDTMTCVVGGLAGRLVGCKVAHVEAGLRSGDIRNPFPEELDRIIAAYLSHYHFCPSDTAVENLARRKGEIVNTHGNTSKDSMQLIQDRLIDQQTIEPYVLISLHRAELLANREVLMKTIEEIVFSAQNSRIIMVMDALTRTALETHHLLECLLQSPIDLREKMSYPEFIQLLVHADRVVTDSGGLQEECGFLEIPCLVHRRATERDDGLGTTARLSMWTPDSITEFLREDLPNKKSSRTIIMNDSPTAIIMQTLRALGILE